MPDKTLIFIPTYNEADNAEAIYREIRKLGLDADILFCDDASVDRTGDIIDGIAVNDRRVFVIHRPGKMGVGSAHKDGIRWAYDKGYRVLITMDCDFSHSPKYIKDFIGLAGQGDIVIGSRYMHKGSLQGWNAYRKVLTHIGHFLTVMLLKMPYDATGAFRLYRLDRIPHSTFALVLSDGYSFFFESLYILMANGFKIVEFPIDLPARTYGHSKMTIGNLSKSVSILGKIFWRKIWNQKIFVNASAPGAAGMTGARRSWDHYWGKKKEPVHIVYDVVAAFYRGVIIRPALDHYMRRYFPVKGASLLHAGCGSGQVDGTLCRQYRMTALDFSPAAIDIYKKFNPDAHQVVRGDITRLDFPKSALDGVYNLGVMEHFTEDEIQVILKEFFKVLKPGGKVVLFWPPNYGLATRVLTVLNQLFPKGASRSEGLFPAEITRLSGPEHARRMVTLAGYQMQSYHFGLRDLWTYAVVVAVKPAEIYQEQST